MRARLADDQVAGTARVVRLGTSSVTLALELRAASDGRVAAETEVVFACWDRSSERRGRSRTTSVRSWRQRHELRRHLHPERDLHLGRVGVARCPRRVGGAGRGEARSGRVRLHRRRRGRRGHDARQPRGVRAPAHQTAHAHGQHPARPLRRGARHAVAGAVPARADRRALDRPRGGRNGRGTRGGRARHPLLPLQRRLVDDRGHRRGDGRRAALVPALLDQRPRDRRQPAPARRPERLLGGRRHARHAHPRLAAARPPPRLPPVHQGRGLRAVLQRPGLPRRSSRSRRRRTCSRPPRRCSRRSRTSP